MKNKKEEKLVDFVKEYVEPHNKKSRKVKNSDIELLMNDAHILYNLCYTQRGIYSGGHAVAHSQINDKDPLNFFVTKDKEVIINPKIINHTKVLIQFVEGCLSFPDREPIAVDRWNKCIVEYHTLFTNKKGEVKIGKKITEELEGRRSKIFQHELQHARGSFIFDIKKPTTEVKDDK